MSLPAFIWPSRRNRDETASVRAGRVLHWVGTAFAIVTLFIGIMAFIFASTPRGVDAGVNTVLVAIAVAVAVRGLRYVLASE